MINLTCRILPRFSRLAIILLLNSGFYISSRPVFAQNTPVIASEPITLELDDDLNILDQVTSVSQLSDVQPTDWAFQALQSLVERYGCIAGYPDGTFKGNRAMTRYEFAAGMNACLDRITELIAGATADLVTREDLLILQKLQEEFAAELAMLRGRVDVLEARTAELENKQFSPTTKLVGETIFSLSDVFGNEDALGNDLDDAQAIFGYRVRLSFLSSFTGEDQLRTRLEYGNLPFTIGNTNMTDLSWSTGDENPGVLNKLEYRFPIGDRTNMWISAVNMNMDDIADPLNPIAISATQGALSYFGAYAPIYKTSKGGGLAIAHDFSDQINLMAGYVANEGSMPTRGLFNGGYNIMSQLTYRPSEKTAIALAYTYNYFAKGNIFLSGYDGSELAEAPFGQDNATSSHNILLNGTTYFSDKFNLSGWVQYTNAQAQGGDRDGDTADIWNWAMIFGFPDLFAKGNAGGLIVGNRPNALKVEGGPEDEDLSWHIETFYKFQVSENISITPGGWVVTNPENNRDPIWVGVLRTSFEF